MKIVVPDIVYNFFKWKHSHIVTCFIGGACLELFMIYFHVGKVSIYQSIKNNLSTAQAERQFIFERMVLEGPESQEQNDLLKK